MCGSPQGSSAGAAHTYGGAVEDGPLRAIEPSMFSTKSPKRRERARFEFERVLDVGRVSTLSLSLKWDLRETGRESAREMRWRELGGSLEGGHGTVEQG